MTLQFSIKLVSPISSLNSVKKNMSIYASVASKPVTHFAPSDWHTNNHLLASNAERLRDGSHNNRQDSSQLRNVTYNQTAWGIHDNTTRLSNRIDDIEKWRETLEKTLRDTDQEIADLEKDKDMAERALEAKALPLDVASECLTLRDGRREIDVVDDLASSELQKVRYSYCNLTCLCNMCIV